MVNSNKVILQFAMEIFYVFFLLKIALLNTGGSIALGLFAVWLGMVLAELSIR